MERVTIRVAYDVAESHLSHTATVEKFKAMLEQGSGGNITVPIPSWASYPRTWSPCASVTRRWPI